MYFDITIIFDNSSTLCAVRITEIKLLELTHLALGEEAVRIVIVPHTDEMREAIGMHKDENTEEFTQRLKKEYEQSEGFREGNSIGSNMPY
jgi:hypothetical protein